MTVAFSSLRDLFVGDEDCDGVYKPGLVALICDALADPPASPMTVAERLYPELLDVGPRTVAKYAEVVGEPPMFAIVSGFDRWKKQRAKAALPASSI